MLQCVAAWRSVLQCVAVCCSLLQCVAVCSRKMESDSAVCCSVVQCGALSCSVCCSVCCSVLKKERCIYRYVCACNWPSNLRTHHREEYTRAHVSIHSMRIYMYIFINEHVYWANEHVYRSIHKYIYVHICIYMYIYIYK